MDYWNLNKIIIISIHWTMQVKNKETTHACKYDVVAPGLAVYSNGWFFFLYLGKCFFYKNIIKNWRNWSFVLLKNTLPSIVYYSSVFLIHCLEQSDTRCFPFSAHFPALNLIHYLVMGCYAIFSDTFDYILMFCLKLWGMILHDMFMYVFFLEQNIGYIQHIMIVKQIMSGAMRWFFVFYSFFKYFLCFG